MGLPYFYGVLFLSCFAIKCCQHYTLEGEGGEIGSVSSAPVYSEASGYKHHLLYTPPNFLLRMAIVRIFQIKLKTKKGELDWHLGKKKLSFT